MSNAVPLMNGDLVTLLSGQLLSANLNTVPYAYGSDQGSAGPNSTYINSAGSISNLPSYGVFKISLVNFISGNDYSTDTDTTKQITTGTYIGLQFTDSGGTTQYLQTSPDIVDDIQYQTNSWTNGDSNSYYRLWNFVTTAGVGYLNNDGSRTFNGNVPISYGQNLFIQSIGKAIDNNNYQYWFIPSSPNWTTELGTSNQYLIEINDQGDPFPTGEQFEFTFYNNMGQLPASSTNTSPSNGGSTSGGGNGSGSNGNANDNDTPPKSNNLVEWVVIGGVVIVILFILGLLALVFLAHVM